MSTANHFELPTDRLSTTDELGRRVYLYPAHVNGRYRRRRNGLSALLIGVFLVLPWVRINGRSAVLLDIAHGKFAIAGVGFWAHEAPLLFLVIGIAVLLLALVTAIWGRVWCGWACPQTVFVDAVFRSMERWIEGDALVRRRLDGSPWSGEKIVRKGLKWSAFVMVSIILSHSFLAYFTGTEAMAQMIQSSPFESPYAFSAMLVMFSLVLFDFGWFREQFCVIVCPYGRFQSVLMDAQSQIVVYDRKRGEPRRGRTARASGDCVNCYRCVQVCPTGIDIRRGTQLECIACTACVDACDEVMTRLHKPRGLIGYGREGHGKISSRTIAYATLLCSLSAALAFVLVSRRPVAVTLLRAQEAPYQESGNGQITNHYKIDLRNQSFDPADVGFALEGGPIGTSLVISNHTSPLPAGAPERADLFIVVPRSGLKQGRGVARIQIAVRSGNVIDRRTEEVAIVGPYL